MDDEFNVAALQERDSVLLAQREALRCLQEYVGDDQIHARRA